jgi:hypothetical protein
LCGASLQLYGALGWDGAARYKLGGILGVFRCFRPKLFLCLSDKDLHERYSFGFVL